MFVVVALVVVVGVVMTAARSGDSGTGDELAGLLDQVLDTAEYDTGVAELDACPLADMDEVMEVVADTPAELLDLTGEGDTAFQEIGDSPAGIFCYRFAETDPDVDAPAGSPIEAVSVSLTATPVGAYEDYLASVFPDEVVTQGDVDEDDGGELHGYCVSAADENGRTGCGADWVDADAQVVLGVYLEGLRDESVARDVLDRVRALVPLPAD